MSERAAIQWNVQAADGPVFGWDKAKVQCANCDGFTGTECPVDGCGVRLVSIQAEEDARYRQRMRVEAEERKARRAEMRARRSA
jgi:hypothetical protein